jgi:hypothetical protein
MDRFPVGTAVTLQIAYVDYNDVAVVPTGVSYTVRNENDDELAADIPVAGPYTDKATITIAGNLNTPAGARMIELKMTNAAGDTFVDAVYEVRDRVRLVLLDNSFITYLQAQLIANMMPNAVGWQGATEDQRIYALMAAYERLTRFAYLIKWPEQVDTQNILLQDQHARITPQMWPAMTPELLAPYPVNFRNALAKAQVIEANAVLTGDPIADKRRAGLMAESVGESKMMWRGGVRPLDYGVHRDTFDALKGYIDYRLTLTRA